MATAWYKPNALPKLLRSFPSRFSDATIEVWMTPCIVRKFGKIYPPHCTTLINPSNPSLMGVHKFPYFPVGGPEPSKQPDKDPHHIMGYVSQWGGMPLGNGMLFPHNVVDGMVHELGGWQLRLQIWLLGSTNGNDDERCPVGHAVSTGPGGLRQNYDQIVHTVPPFYKHCKDENPEYLLSLCYRNALQLSSTGARVACPLLGAGGRGFPLQVAIDVAANEAICWRENNISGSTTEKERLLAFGIPDETVATTLVEAISAKEKQQRDPIQE